ncbi:MAG TPA: hypothetical protein ENN75_03350, partial [candidate division Zixibacteria bacterium]|nr:hypothetical protein [candidate division Zixibacteria bacterium]
LMQKGLRPGESPELWMLEKPEKIREAHDEYLRAGAEILTTNTFGASRFRLREYGRENEGLQICETAVRLAKESAGENALVAGSIGPVGLKFHGENLEVIYRAFEEQAGYIAESGADLLIIETMIEITEAEIALKACKNAVEIPVVISLGFVDGDKMPDGTTPENAVEILAKHQPLAIGTNCGDPKEMIENVRELRRSWNGPILAEPSAGLPGMREGVPVWRMTPEEMADIALKLHSAGANLIGSCCGTTPEFTSAIVKAVKRCNANIL